MTAADTQAIEAFKRDVIEPSMTNLVIVDFWAEWCGPCKQLGPVIEKVAADAMITDMSEHVPDGR